MKKTAIFIIITAIAINICVPFYADSGETYTSAVEASAELNLTSKSCVLMEKTTGKILFESNKDEHLPPASVTKVMTMLLILEAVESGRISFSDNVAASERASSMGGTQIYLEPGEVMTVDELFKSVAVPSANDAAVALAEYVAGTEDEFVRQMNVRAAELGMSNTNFTNCTGLFDDNGHYTTAYDLALATRELLKHPIIHEYTTIWTDSLRNGTFGLANTNKMLRTYQGMNGMKTGYTQLAGHCLSGTAERNGLTLIAVVLGGPSSKERFADVASMLDYGFATYSVIDMAPEKEITLEVKKGKEPTVTAIPDSGFSAVVKKGSGKNTEVIIEFEPSIEAPIEKGTQVGTVSYKIGDETVSVVPIRTVNSVEKADVGDFFVKIIREILK
ncbi:MAG: D-alanyl-D-alanine carboxypeptidase [Clostridia bacterium]|nr:D-alanyl-D-alanine carboxypeptidase [Clostridia bacterium]